MAIGYIGKVNTWTAVQGTAQDAVLETTIEQAQYEAKVKRWPVNAQVFRVDGDSTTVVGRFTIEPDGTVRQLGRRKRST